MVNKCCTPDFSQVCITPGASFLMSWMLRYYDDSPIDLTGATVVLEITLEDATPVLMATIASGRLMVQTPADGRIDANIPAADLGNPIRGTRMIYKLTVTHLPNTVVRYDAGKIKVTR